MKATDWRVVVRDLIWTRSILLLPAATYLLASTCAYADGCFVFRWNKQKDINEPTQKAIILHDRNREDLILQVKYEGPAENFGWLIPVPGQPEVRLGSMQPFYELSRLTQKHFREGLMTHYAMGMQRAGTHDEEVKVIEVKTVGAYEVAILSSTNSSALADWLETHQFTFPKEKQGVLDRYTRQRWFFVAARIDPKSDGFPLKPSKTQPATSSTAMRNELASGELHPIIISFPSEKCIFPLAISAVNGTPSEISLYVLSSEPLVSPVIFDRKLSVYRTEKEKGVRRRTERKQSWAAFRTSLFRNSPEATRMKEEDPNDPPPPSVFERPSLGAPEPEASEDPEYYFYGPHLQLVRSMSVEGADTLKASGHDLPRINGKAWWLIKLVETFQPDEMVDLKFEGAIPFLAERLRHEDGEAAAHCLPQYGSLATSTVLQSLADPDAAVRTRALVAAAEMSDPKFVDPLLVVMEDEDVLTRRRACYAVLNNWDQKFAKPLLRLLSDPGRGVAQAALFCLRQRLGRNNGDINLDTATLRTILVEDSPASLFALEALEARRKLSNDDRKHLFGSTNLSLVSSAFTPLRGSLQLDDLTPLTTNSLPLARMMALGVLIRMADRAAVDRIISMLHDPDEAMRWRTRSAFRRVTGQKLGADPAAYEKWWEKNRDSFVPILTDNRLKR